MYSFPAWPVAPRRGLWTCLKVVGKRNISWTHDACRHLADACHCNEAFNSSQRVGDSSKSCLKGLFVDYWTIPSHIFNCCSFSYSAILTFKLPRNSWNNSPSRRCPILPNIMEILHPLGHPVKPSLGLSFVRGSTLFLPNLAALPYPKLA